MTSKRSSIVLFTLIALLPIGTGCGASPSTTPLSKKQYERQVNAIQQETFARANPATILASTQSGDPASGLLAVQQAATTEARELSRLSPPPDISQAHRRLVTALRDYANDLGSIMRALKAHKLAPDAIPNVLRSLKSASSIRAARTEIIKRGYGIV